MISEGDDQEVFEITDFTTASDWERFIASLEEFIHEWKLTTLPQREGLSKGSFVRGSWKTVEETVAFADFKFVIVRHWLHSDSAEETSLEEFSQTLNDIMCENNDFCYSGNTHCLTQWYGLRDFLVISPAEGTDVISNESRAKLLLSSVCIAVNNTCCRLPVFIQLHHKDENFYLGICEGNSVRTHFQMVHLNKSQSQWTHLTGLLDIFKSKLGCPFSVIPPVMISVCFTYILKDWHHRTSWSQPLPGEDLQFSCSESNEFVRLPFGTCEYPIRSIKLCAIWHRFTEDVAVDNHIHSDLDPVLAPLWAISVCDVEEPLCLLGNYLTELINFCVRHKSRNQSHTKLHAANAEESDFAPALDRLSGTMSNVPSVSTVVYHTKRRLHHSIATTVTNGPIPEARLKDILFFLFPDAINKPTVEITADAATDYATSKFHNVKDILRGFKHCPVRSLVYSLSLCLCHVGHTYRGIAAIDHLWHEIVLEMRHRWENNISIPGLERGTPNLSTCLIYQKFQMLNYCIEKRKTRAKWLAQQRDTRVAASSSSSSSSTDRAGSSDDDEFFDCNDPEPMEESADSSEYFVDTVAQTPEGRLHRFNNVTLLDSDEPLYIPHTQEPSPMTEDQLEAHAEVLIQLGTDEEGAQLRAQMQSACLLSDMQAFKAANPGCILEDFVCWYSPSDWIEVHETDEQGKHNKKGHLSPRMLIPGNIWQEVWTNAKPIPVRRQKRLFDDTKEGEKVLHYLASLTSADVIQALMPMVLHASIVTIMKNDDSLLPFLDVALESIAGECQALSKASSPTLQQYLDVIDMIESLEAKLSLARTLRGLFVQTASESGVDFAEMEDSVRQILDGKVAVELPGGSKTPAGKVVLALVEESYQSEAHPENPDAESGKKFPSPDRREYILRCCVPRPAPFSRLTPQRMYCCASASGEFRLAGAFSTDTAFQ